MKNLIAKTTLLVLAAALLSACANAKGAVTMDNDYYYTAPTTQLTVLSAPLEDY